MENILSDDQFLNLSREVKEILANQSWFQKHGMELTLITVRLALFFLGFYIFSLPGVIATGSGIVIMSYFAYAVGISGTHETRHNAMVQSKLLNRILAYFFADFWSAQSNEWWHQRHVVVHHQHTNVPSYEKGGTFYFPWMNKYVYFFVTPFFVQPWLIYNSINYLKKDKIKLILYLLATSAGFILQTLLFALVVPIPYAILTMLCVRTLFAPIFVHLAVFNHIGLENPETRLPWLPHQTKTTRNIRPNLLLNAMGGNAFVDCHIEHHLFPSLSNRMLAVIRPTVKKYVTNAGYKYVEEGYMHVLGKCLKHYDEFLKGVRIDL